MSTAETQTRRRRHPDWLKVRAPVGETVMRTRRVVKSRGLHTVCEEARCPNLGECWAHSTATFMLMGDICTRGCRFCNVATGKPGALDPDEPRRVAQAVADLRLQHIVLTSVDRDDLDDLGAGHFAAVVSAIHDAHADVAIECLIPDFQGRMDAVDRVLDARPNVLNHNIETVPRLYRNVRPGAKYDWSLSVLERAARREGVRAKTGLMLGLGEEPHEVERVLRDLKQTGCSILTIGQYLQPSAKHLPVARYVEPAEFDAWRDMGLSLGFRHVESAPLVRSSYHAWKHV